MIKWAIGYNAVTMNGPYMTLYMVDEDNNGRTDYLGNRYTYIVLDKTRRGNYSFIFRSSNNTLYAKTKSFNFAKVMKANIPEVAKKEIIRSQIVVAINEVIDTMSSLFQDKSISPIGLGGNRFTRPEVSVFTRNCYKWLKEQIKEGDKKNDSGAGRECQKIC